MILVGVLLFFGFWNVLLPRGLVSRIVGTLLVGMALRLMVSLIPGLNPAVILKVNLILLGMFSLYFLVALAWLLRSRFLGRSEGLDEYLGLRD